MNDEDKTDAVDIDLSPVATAAGVSTPGARSDAYGPPENLALMLGLYVESLVDALMEVRNRAGLSQPNRRVVTVPASQAAPEPSLFDLFGRGFRSVTVKNAGPATIWFAVDSQAVRDGAAGVPGAHAIRVPANTIVTEPIHSPDNLYLSQITAAAQQVTVYRWAEVLPPWAGTLP
jgi:hypothetical protein